MAAQASPSYRSGSLNPADSEPRKPGRPKTKPLINLTDFEFTEEELIVGLSDPTWRLNNLYKVVDEDKQVVTFRLRKAQQKLLEGLHTRNVILKARKLGFSTFIQILGLDTALFSPNERVVVIAQDKDTSEAIFRDTIKFAYDNLPAPLKIAAPTLGEPSKDTIAFTNSSIISVLTSSRGGTPSFLHISEFGKIAAKDPGKAKEIITGSITSVAENGLIFVESTAEGNSGAFFDMVKTAQDLQLLEYPLSKLDLKFFFFGWWENPKYTLSSRSVVFTTEDNEYYEELELAIGRTLTLGQKTWYANYLRATFNGNRESMWQEHPGTPDEAFKVSMEGAYFKDQFKKIRQTRRIGLCEYDDMYPVSTFWDIGANDMTAIWLVQPRRTYYAVIGYIEESGEPFSYFVRELDALGYVFDYHYLPHDANHRRQGATKNLTPEEMLLSVAPHYRVQPVEKTPDKMIPIQQARILLGQCVFDESRCAAGLKHLESYRKEWNARTATWRNTPRHGLESNAADAFLQMAQAKALGIFSAVGSMSSANGTAFGADQLDDLELGF